MLTALFQLMNIILVIAIFIGIPYMIFLLFKRMKSMEEKIDNLEKLLRSQNDSNN